MISTSSLAKEKVWVDKAKYDLAEKLYYEKLANVSPQAQKLKNLIENMEAVNIKEDVKMDLAQNQKIEVAPQEPESKVKAEEKISKPDLTASKKAPEAKKVPDVKTKQSPEKQQGLNTKKDKNNEIKDKILPVQTSPPEVTNDTQVEFELTIKCNPKKSKKPKKDKKKNLAKNTTNAVTDTNTVIKNEINSQINAIVDNAKKGAPQSANANTLASEVAKAREHIKNSIQCIDKVTTSVTTNTANPDANKLDQLQKEHKELKQKVTDLSKIVTELVSRVAQLEKEPKKSESTSKSSQHPPAQPKQDDDADDGVDLFASDSEEEDAEAAKIKEQRLAEYAAKKSKKPVLIAKSNIILDVKPWDDETDMKVMETEVRKITTDGLIWGASKLVPLAYGIHKLQISCVVEDDKVSVDWLTETIEEIQDYVQSVDIAAFNKV